MISVIAWGAIPTIGFILTVIFDEGDEKREQWKREAMLGKIIDPNLCLAHNDISAEYAFKGQTNKTIELSILHKHTAFTYPEGRVTFSKWLGRPICPECHSKMVRKEYVAQYRYTDHLRGTMNAFLCSSCPYIEGRIIQYEYYGTCESFLDG